MINKQKLLDIVVRINNMAGKLKGSSLIPAKIVCYCIELEILINGGCLSSWDHNEPEVKSDMAGQLPKPKQIPSAPQEWYYLGELYEKALMAAQFENSELRTKMNTMAQRLEMQRRTIKGMRRTPDEY